LVVSIIALVDTHKEQSIQSKLEVEKLLDHANDLLGNDVLTLIWNGGKKPHDIEEADHDIRDALTRDPRNARGYFLRGMLGIATRDPETAAAGFEKVGKLEPNAPDSANGFGMYAQAFGLKPVAVAMYREALRKDKDSFVIKLNLAGALIDVGKLTEAISLLDEVAVAHPTDCQVSVLLGNARSSLGNLDQAIKELRKAALLCPESQVVKMNFANVLAKNANYEEALQEYMEASKLSAEYAGSYLSIASVLIKLNRLDAARENIKLALQKDSHLAAAHMLDAWLLAQDMHYEEALSEYQRAAKDDAEYPQEQKPEPIAIALGLAAVLTDLNRDEDALAYLDKALLIDSKSKEAIGLKKFVLSRRQGAKTSTSATSSHL
jgi:tetratricopeptide (TPR) repeat protein